MEQRVSVARRGRWQAVTCLLVGAAVLFCCTGWLWSHRHHPAGRMNDVVVILACVTNAAILTVKIQRLRR